MTIHSSADNSFYGVFRFDSSLMDGGDHTINFEMIEITRNIPKLGLSKGMTFDGCYFDFKSELFQFVVWGKTINGEMHPNPDKSIDIKQADLAPYLVWFEKDLPIDDES